MVLLDRMIFVRRADSDSWENFTIGGTLRSYGPFNTKKTPLALGLQAWRQNLHIAWRQFFQSQTWHSSLMFSWCLWHKNYLTGSTNSYSVPNNWLKPLVLHCLMLITFMKFTSFLASSWHGRNPFLSWSLINWLGPCASLTNADNLHVIHKFPCM